MLRRYAREYVHIANRIAQRIGRHAPDIYLDVIAVTRELGGGLAIGGGGVPVEWAVHMRRFADDALLARIAEQRGIDASLARALADVVHIYHRGAPSVHAEEPRARLARIVAELADELAKPALDFASNEARQLISACELRLDAVASLLLRRSGAGFVRRCHGDLHLGNIILWQGRPTPFDAIEFDETLATIDTLYDPATSAGSWLWTYTTPWGTTCAPCDGGDTDIRVDT